jgi:hypothetical protein
MVTSPAAALRCANAFYSAMLVIELVVPFILFFATSRLPQSP